MNIDNLPKSFMADFHCKKCENATRVLADQSFVYYDMDTDVYHLYQPRAEALFGGQNASYVTPHIIKIYGGNDVFVFYHAHCAVVSCGVNLPGLFYSRSAEESSYYLFSLQHSFKVIADSLSLLSNASLDKRQEKIDLNLSLLQEGMSFFKKLFDPDVFLCPTEARETTIRNYVAMSRHGVMNLQTHALVF